MRRSAKHSDDYRALIAILVEARAEAKVSQTALAARLGRPQSFVSKYETGERRLDFVETLHVVEALGLSSAELLKRFGRRRGRRLRDRILR